MMALDEHARHKLHTKLEQTLGPEEAAAIMELLPPVGWADVATKRDLENLRALTKSDLDQHHAATKHQIEELRADTNHQITELRADTSHQISELGSSLRQEMAESQTDTQRQVSRLTWSMTIALLVNALAVVGLAIQVGSV